MIVKSTTKDDVLVVADKLVNKMNYAKVMADGDGVNVAYVRDVETYTDIVAIKTRHGVKTVFGAPCIVNPRAESFVMTDGSMEYGVHILKRYAERSDDDGSDIRVCNPELDERTAKLLRHLAMFVNEEEILGVVAESPAYGSVAVGGNSGCVMRTTHGLLLVSANSLHKGIPFANSWISDDMLNGSQRTAVRLWDRAYELRKEGKDDMAAELFRQSWDAYMEWFK